MPYIFPTYEQLMTWPLDRVRGLDIRSPEEELIVQRVVNDRISEIPIEQDIYRGDVPDIKTPEQEAEWQKIIDERTARIRQKVVDIRLPNAPEAGTPASQPVDLAQKENELKKKIAGIKTAKQKLIKEKAK